MTTYLNGSISNDNKTVSLYAMKVSKQNLDGDSYEIHSNDSDFNVEIQLLQHSFFGLETFYLLLKQFFLGQMQFGVKLNGTQRWRYRITFFQPKPSCLCLLLWVLLLLQ